MADDVVAVKHLLDTVGIECTPKSIFRMGVFKQPTTQRSRLLKIIFPTRSFQSDAIKQWKIKGKKMFQHLNIRPSLTLEQRNRRKHLIDECKKKRQENPDQDWIVYADTIILRSEVHIFRKQN
ncbi:unnamed protein product [Meloidogyne enterolobii]